MPWASSLTIIVSVRRPRTTLAIAPAAPIPLATQAQKKRSFTAGKVASFSIRVSSRGCEVMDGLPRVLHWHRGARLVSRRNSGTHGPTLWLQ
jgi:hypothetical protein